MNIMPGLVDNVRWSLASEKQGRIWLVSDEDVRRPCRSHRKRFELCWLQHPTYVLGAHRTIWPELGHGSFPVICLRREGRKATSTPGKKRSRRRRGLGAYLSYLRTVHCGRATPWRGTITRLNMRTGRRPKFS